MGRRFSQRRVFSSRHPAKTKFEKTGGDELLFADGVSRQQPFLCVVTAPARAAGLNIEGRLIASGEIGPVVNFWSAVTGGLSITAPSRSPLANTADRAGEIFPWFIHNALVHYLSPRGWNNTPAAAGVMRDVCQGPVELLLAFGRYEPIRDLLGGSSASRMPTATGRSGSCSSTASAGIRPGDSHGDIVYWPCAGLAISPPPATRSCSMKPCCSSTPTAMRRAEKATVWQRRARTRPNPTPRHPGERSSPPTVMATGMIPSTGCPTCANGCVVHGLSRSTIRL